MSVDFKGPDTPYYCSGRASHGLRVRQRYGLVGQNRCRTYLNGPVGLYDYFSFVIFYESARL